MLTPRRTDVNNWEYILLPILDEGPGQIIGKPTAADVDGDGFKEIFIPSWFMDRLFIYTYGP